jgi:hypothetical protein
VSRPSFQNSDNARQKGHWLTRQRVQVYSCALLILYLVVPVAHYLHENWTHLLTPDTFPQDYLAFWGASWLALHGHAIDAYNVDVIEALQHTIATNMAGGFPWLYPPTFLLLVFPVALVPYTLSLVLFLGLTLVAFIAVINAIQPGKTSLLLALAFPGVARVLVSGQNSLLTAAIMGLGLVLLPRRPILAGITFGVLCIKPQLAVLIPLALLCVREWKTLTATALTAACLSAISIACFGIDTVMAFIHNMGWIENAVNSGCVALTRVPTFFAMARQLHFPTHAAYACQALSAGFAVASLVYVWLLPSAYELRAATLVCATLAFTPYLLDYDLVWYGLVIAWYCRHALKHGFRRYEREWLTVLWFAPALGTLAAQPLDVPFLPLLTIGTLGMLVSRAWSETRRCARNDIAIAVTSE